MGMYTELVLKCTINSDAPQMVKDVLNHLFAGSSMPDVIPDHDFFKCSRWSLIGRGSSFYHHPKVVNSVPNFDFTDCFYIFSRSDIKNYDGEIAKFSDWITPYVDGCGDVCIGWSWCEEDERPELIIVNKGENE